MRRSLIMLRCGALALGAGLFSGTSVRAEPIAIEPFKVNPATPDVIEMDGEITAASALAFRRALAAVPNAKLLVLNSPGGTVQMGLLIADDVHQRKMATLIPTGSQCMSACAYIFLAGSERQADGQLGVHQISSDLPNLENAQMSISDIIDVLNRFDTPIEVLTIMFRTPPDDMHVFTPDEVVRYAINRKSGDPAPTPAAVVASPAVTPSPAVASAEPSSPPPPALSAPAMPPLALDGKTIAALSAIEGYARQPTRMALYSGLDFFGEDLGTRSVADAPACAAQCFEMGGSCKAFTFNLKTQPSRGPNCFLKASRGRIDGNSVALSGELLTRAERDPVSVTLSVIDPETDLYKDVDLPGLDLSRKPHPTARNPLDCRLACVSEDRCVAFTYLKTKKQCWLKGTIGTPRQMAGAVTGAKRKQTFTPSTIGLE